ncbi:MAG: M20/M25/M40 family metallo-hydrolase [Clostridia bacterium]|nr:M20/M25/M40 family metallo-hydrolase [Clostridia bacterium]
MDTKELLKMLTDSVSIAGSEGNITEVIKNLLAEYGCEDIRCDRMGNIIGEYKCGKKNAPRLMLEAHMDEIGLMVSGFSDEGSLLFVPVGGFDEKVLPGSEVTVHTENGDIYGIIGAKPPHLVTDRNKMVKMKDMSIDIGFCREETTKRVKIGDLISFNTQFTALEGQVAGRCFDDRAGIAAIFKALDYVRDLKIECDIICAITVQEELGMRGAKVVCETAKCDAAICIDAGFGTSANSSEGFELGSGVIVSVGPNLHPKLNKIIFDAASEYKIEVATDVESGNTGTNAWAVQVSGFGVPVALLSFPLRYMHSTYEVIDEGDIEAIGKLCAYTALKYKGGEQLCY